MSKRINAILFVDSNRLLFYSKGATATYQIKLNPDIFVDLEVINREKFEHLIDNFFQVPSIKGKEFDITIIFSQRTTFETELTSANSKAEFEETQRFLDMVPFEEVLNNSYRINKKTKIVAINKILYNILKLALEKNKAHVVVLLPMGVLATANSELASKIDFPLIESKLESFMQYSIVDLGEMGLGGEVPNAIGIKRKDVRLYILVIVLIGLFAVLIFLIYTTFIAPPKRVQSVNTFHTSTATSRDQNTKSFNATDSAQISTPSSQLSK